MSSARSATWLFSRNLDLAVFGGSALLSLVALAIGLHLGLDDSPEWTWIAGVLLVDVAHVWSTAFRTYLDGDELRRRPLLYTVTPIAAYVIALALYDAGPMLFWRALAYLAVFHFVRQQYGWVALYRARAGETDGRLLDTLAIYAATLYPILWWHANPRHFAWFLEGDFATVPQLAATIAAPFYWAILIAYFARSIANRFPNPGKDLVVFTTALLWYLGIVHFDSDYAFTVTNVFIHGIPYVALVYTYQRANGRATSFANRLLAFGPLVFLGFVWLAALGEEALWDMTLWRERAWLSRGISLQLVERWLVPLLAVPQIAHYVLDGFIWRKRSTSAWLLRTLPDAGITGESTWSDKLRLLFSVQR